MHMTHLLAVSNLDFKELVHRLFVAQGVHYCKIDHATKIH